MIESIQIGDLKWVHIPTPNDEGIQYLKDNYDFHPLDLEDCQTIVQRPKIDVYDDYYFMILHFPYFDKALRYIKTKEVKIFWGKDYIITIGKSHWVIRALFTKTNENKDVDVEELPNTSDSLLYTILESLMEESFKILRIIEGHINIISADMFGKRPEKVIERISATRKNLILLNTAFKPQLRVFQKFESGIIKGYADNMEDYWGDILDDLHRMWDSIEDYEELIQGLSQTFDSAMSNRTNEIMKVLTIFSAVLLPLTFLTGLYGMNVDLPFQQSSNAFMYISLGLLLVIILLLFFFRKRRWI